MRRFNPEVIDLFERQNAVANRDQLLAIGISKRQIHHMVQSGLTVVMYPGVYRIALAPVSRLTHCTAACLRRPDLFLSHPTAGKFHGLRSIGPAPDIHATVPGAVRIATLGLVIHRSFSIDPIDVITRADGIRMTGVDRTIFDLSSMRPAGAIESMIEQALHEGWTTIASLNALADRVRERGRNGSALFGEVLASRSSGPAVASALELRFERAVLAVGLPAPVRQAPIRLGTGVLVHADFFWPQHRLVVEIDHIAWHGSRADRTRDSGRDRGYRQLGLDVLRFNDVDVNNSLEAVVQDTVRAITRRSRES